MDRVADLVRNSLPARQPVPKEHIGDPVSLRALVQHFPRQFGTKTLLQQHGETSAHTRPLRRKDYLAFYPEPSTATATRDLRNATVGRRIVVNGKGRAAVYRRG
jgi:hypothetical protein